MSAQTNTTSGKLVVAIILLIVASIAGGLIWYNRPRDETKFAPTLSTETGDMVLIPGGRFIHGQAKETAIAPAFYIDRTEVTNRAYAKFCAATSRPLPTGDPGLPVVNINIQEATDFARWAGKRLPDAMEWEKAARGASAGLYPWGDEADASRANVSDNPNATGALAAADAVFGGSASYKLLHMIGNAQEFVRNSITPSAQAFEEFRFKLSPPPDRQEPWFSVKGGSFSKPLAAAIPYAYVPIPARFRAPDIGFRCVKDPPR